MDFEDFERRIGHDTNTFILCNPHNPTGNCWSADDLLRIGEICLRRRVVVLADEIHCDFVNRGHRYTPFASLKDKDVVTTASLSRRRASPSAWPRTRCGWFYSTNPDLMARVRANHRSDLTHDGHRRQSGRPHRRARSGSIRRRTTSTGTTISSRISWPLESP